VETYRERRARRKARQHAVETRKTITTAREWIGDGKEEEDDDDDEDD
jgi:hypothetical protein